MAFLDITQTDVELQAALDAVEDSGLADDGLAFTGANPTILGGDSDGSIILSAHAAGTGGNVAFYGPTHGTKAGDIELRNTTDIKGGWDESASMWTFTDGVTLPATTVSGDLSTDDILVGDGDGILIGHGSKLTINSLLSEMQVLGTDGADSQSVVARFSANSSPPQLNFLKSRAAIGSNAIITTADQLGQIVFLGDDGVDYATIGALIRAISEGTIGADRIPAKLTFSTGTDAAPTVVTTALTLDSAQLATFAAGITLSAGVLTVPNGVVGAPSLTWVGSPTTGLFQGGSDQLQIANAGVETLEIGAENTVGIGRGASAALTLVVRGAGTDNVLKIENSAGDTLILSGNADLTMNTAFNAADTALNVSKDTTTNRSINAAGTLNASGADYAEYEFKAPSCGTVAKGDIVGFDVNGLITDKFSDAISFAIKSSDPSYVGGDTWGTDKEVGARPEKPAFVDPGYPNVKKPRDLYDEPTLDTEPPVDPGSAPLVSTIRLPEETDESYAVRQQEETTAMALWAAQKAQYDTDLPHYERAELKYQTRHVAWEAAEVIWTEEITAYNDAMSGYDTEAEARKQAVEDAMPAYNTALAAWKAGLETARQSVDRIAYAGKVPCNMQGGNVGEYVIPTLGANDAIKGTAKSALTAAEYRLCVGQIKKDLGGGQVDVIVKMG